VCLAAFKHRPAASGQSLLQIAAISALYRALPPARAPLLRGAV